MTRERKLELIIACVATSSLNKEDKMELVEFIERLRRIERMWRNESEATGGRTEVRKC